MTREEAIKFAEYAQIMADGKPDIQEFYKIAEAALREQETLTQSQNSLTQWISVADRLPEVGQRVLVCSLYDLQNIGWHLGDGRWQIKTAYPDTPTHWMPLPEPPEEEV